MYLLQRILSCNSSVTDQLHHQLNFEVQGFFAICHLSCNLFSHDMSAWQQSVN